MMAGICKVITAMAIFALPVAASPQIGLLPLAGTRGGLEGLAGPLLRDIDLDHLPPARIAEQLRIARLDRLASIVRQNGDRVEFDSQKAPSLRGILLATGVTQTDRAKAEANGFSVIGEEVIAELDLAFVRFALPNGMSLRTAQKQLASLLPDAEISAENLYFASGPTATSGSLRSSPPPLPGALSQMTPTPVIGPVRLGLIDSGIAALPGLKARVTQKGFARGAPRAGDHGTAVASLALGVAGAGSTLYAADVYGDDPAGGTASAIARALGWLVSQKTSVVNVSLVGPDNALVRAAIRQAQAKGTLIVAAVGNDGPAAPPAYPAAQSDVIGVTGVDSGGRILPEAGRGGHVAFAAPGRNLATSALSKKQQTVRGTSFAAPLVAGLLARLYPTPRPNRIDPAVRGLISTARDLGKKGRDPVYGHGLVCADCGR